jgi:hypothetical protein
MMKYIFAFFLVSLSTCLWLTVSTAAQDGGAITGTVVDENKVPLVKAKVNADPVDSRPTGSLVRYVETNSDGRFLIDRLPLGKYRVFAKKEDAGYPDMSWSLYSNDLFPIVAITPTSRIQELRIQLGPKGALLMGSVTNAITGAPLNAGFKLLRVGDPNKWISTSLPSDYRVLVPPSTDVLLEVSAPGFQTWYYGGPSDPSKRPALHLESGSQMRLDIPMARAHDNSVHPSKFMIPEGYIGWLRLEYNVKDAPSTPVENEVKVFKFPKAGLLNTSSPGPTQGAENEYFYYAEDGSVHAIPTDYRIGKGMIWGQYQGSRGGVMTLFGFFVGSEEQYNKYQSQSAHPGQIPSP